MMSPKKYSSDNSNAFSQVSALYVTYKERNPWRRRRRRPRLAIVLGCYIISDQNKNRL